MRTRALPSPVVFPRRIRLKEAADALGATVRHVQSLVARGDLPGAARVGKLWTFDVRKLERYIAKREVAACQPKRTYIKGATFGGSAPHWEEKSDAKAFALAMSRLLGKSVTPNSKSGRRRRSEVNSE
jgi:excisionase family DNA binding protein